MEKIVVSCLESRIDENQSVYSRFLLGPFLSGHAVTVATSLRRALLSEVKNIAITALHIQGVTHEFSTLVGIRESVLELSLNFQQIILSTQTKSKSVEIGYLHVQGPAIVHANDLKLPDGIECVNPTQYIATLSTEGLLVVKFLIGEKKSFLKSNTTTLTSKKIKQAKVYGAKLSQSLLSHAEYDPPRLFRLLRQGSLSSGSIVRRTIKAESTSQFANSSSANLNFRKAKGSLAKESVLGGTKTNFSPEPGSDTPPKHLGVSCQSTLFDKGKPFPPSVGKHNILPTRVAEVDSQSEPNFSLKEQNLAEPSSTKVEFLTGVGRNEAASAAGPVYQKGGSKHSLGLEPKAPSTGSLSRDREPAVDPVGRKALDIDLEQLERSSSSSRLTDSILDQSANHIADEFNSEVCLRTIIPLNPIFTPVYQVNFGIERDDLSNQIRERVIMEVWTNGSIHPRQAVHEAALSTMSIFSKLRKTFQLDSHSLAWSTHPIAPLARFARGNRLHKTKSLTKGEVVNDDASESVEPLATLLSLALQSRAKGARTPLGSLMTGISGRAPLLREHSLSCSGVLRTPEHAYRSSPFLALGCSAPQSTRTGHAFAEQKQAKVSERKSKRELSRITHVTRERFAPVAQARTEFGLLPEGGKSCVNFRSFVLAEPSRTELDVTNSVPQKLNSFSSLGFVKSRHPVSLCLQNFGRSHLRGETFLWEQSFGLKARFFKGRTRAPRECSTVLSKGASNLEYTSETELPSYTTAPSFRQTLKRTFLPSFKVVLRRFGCLRNDVLARDRESISSRYTQQNPEQNQAGFTKAWLLFKLGFCLAGTLTLSQSESELSESDAFDPPWRGSRYFATFSLGSVTQSKSQRSKDHAVNQVSIGLGRLLLMLSNYEQRGEHGSRVQSTPTFVLAKAMKAGALLPSLFYLLRRTRVKGARTSCSRSDLLSNKVSTSKKGGRTFRLSTHRSSGWLSRITSWSNFLALGCSAPQSTRTGHAFAPQKQAKVTARSTQPSKTRQFACSAKLSKQLKSKPILFLIKYRTFSFTGNALRIFRSKQEDSLFLLPLAKQLIRVKMARLFTSCLPLISRRSEPSLPFSLYLRDFAKPIVAEEQLDVKQVLLSLAASFTPALRSIAKKEGSKAKSALGLKSNPFGLLRKQKRLLGNDAPSESFAERGAPLFGTWNLVSSLAQNQEVRELALSLRSLLLRKSVSASSRTNLKKKFGFFQFASHGYRPGRLHGVVQGSMSKSVGGNRSATLPRRLKKRWQLTLLRSKSERSESSAKLGSAWTRRGIERSAQASKAQGVCVNRTESLAKGSSPGPIRLVSLSCASFACARDRESVRSGTVPYDLTTFSLGLWVRRARAWTRKVQARPSFDLRKQKTLQNNHSRRFLPPFRETKAICFATPLIMTKAPPLCLSSGLVTLLSSLGPTSRCSPKYVAASKSPAHLHFRSLSLRSLLRSRKRKSKTAVTRALGCSAPQSKKVSLAKVRRFQLVPQTGAEFRLPNSNFVNSIHSSFASLRARRASHPKGPLSLRSLLLRKSVSALGSPRGTNSKLRLRNTNFLAQAKLAHVPKAIFRKTKASDAKGRVTEGGHRLSILYSSHLDKISFLSSDLANLSLSLKTYTFLKKKGKNNIASLLEDSPNTLFSLLNGDKKMFHEIERCILFLGLPFKERS